MKNIKIEKLGMFSAKADTIPVSDPYVSSITNVKDILKGDWVVEVVKADLGFLTDRPIELRAHHESHVYPHDEWEVCGRVDVDSATVSIGDFQCLSGYGDGSYDVERLVHGNHTVAIRVIFVEESN